MVLGAGGATINDCLFFRFLKDFKISKFEAGVLSALSKIIWTGLIVLIITGLGLYLQNAERLNHSPKFLVKMIVVAIILLNGIALNLFIAPRLRQIFFAKSHEHQPGELRSFRRLAFALGAVSITSWYSALILGFLRNLSYSFSVILGVYFLAVIIGVAISQIAEKFINRTVL